MNHFVLTTRTLQARKWQLHEFFKKHTLYCYHASTCSSVEIPNKGGCLHILYIYIDITYAHTVEQHIFQHNQCARMMHTNKPGHQTQADRCVLETKNRLLLRVQNWSTWLTTATQNRQGFGPTHTSCNSANNTHWNKLGKLLFGF